MRNFPSLLASNRPLGRAIVLFAVFAAPSFAQFARNRYALFLEDPPVSARFKSREEMRTSAAVAYRRQIEAGQQKVLSELASRKITVAGSVSTLLNAVFVIAPPSRLAELRSIPGVIGVRRMRRGKKALNRAVELVNAPTAWNAVGGDLHAGSGMKIAILDTGIDQTHPAFQDSSLAMPAGFPICTTGHPEDCAYTNNKVIVARSYVRMIAAGTDPSNPAADSMPDDYSPRDRDGHGSAVASAAAANTNTGTVTFMGVAPKAYLGNYKIYGTDGVNDYPSDDVWITAIEDVLNDGMDVANLSSGAPALSGPLDTGSACGEPAGTPCDPLAAAFEAAVQAGLVIAVSAGNEGQDGYVVYPTFNSVASPADAPSVIAAGATTNSHVFQPSVSVTGTGVPTNLVGIGAQISDSFFTPSEVGGNEAPLIDVVELGNDGYACTSLPANSLAGAYALIERGPASDACTFSVKGTNAQAAGAIGIVFYMYDSSATITPEGLDEFVGPAVMISNSAGLSLKSYIDAHPKQVVLIDSAGVEQNLSVYSSNNGFDPALTQNQSASYSSFGPALNGAVKPDLVATGGFDVYQSPDPNDTDLPAPPGMYLAAQNYDPNGELYSVNRYGAADGTSFSSPLTAGAAALVKQAHPGYTATQIKSALVNSTAQSVTTDTYGDPVDVEWIGAGLLNAGAAMSATVTAEPSSVSFGYVQAVPLTEAITVTNKGTGSVTLSAALIQNTTPAGATLALKPGSLTLAAGAAGTLSVTLSGAVPAAGEYSGFVALNGSGASLQLPYMYLVGDGVPANATPIFGTSFEGAPGQDIGPYPIQVIDQFGVPVVGAPVAFAVDPIDSVGLQSVDGEPACSGTSFSVTCATDNYGIAYAEIILGSATGSPTITATAAGTQIQADVAILPLPAITAARIVDAAVGQSLLAPGSYIAIYGENLVDPAELINPDGDPATTLILPLVIDGTTVSFDVPSAGISVPGYLTFVSPGQINVQVPWELQGQSSVKIKVTVDETLFGNVETVSLASYAPEFFEISGAVAALDKNYHLIQTSNPVAGGQLAQLFANGLGPVSNQPADGNPASSSPLSKTTDTPVVMIGGHQAVVSFSGLAPGFPGLYQIDVTVPTGLSAGNQPITVAIGGKTSEAATIAVQ
jgi:minor extracellular serine protease Vpr